MTWYLKSLMSPVAHLQRARGQDTSESMKGIRTVRNWRWHIGDFRYFKYQSGSPSPAPSVCRYVLRFWPSTHRFGSPAHRPPRRCGLAQQSFVRRSTRLGHGKGMSRPDAISWQAVTAPATCLSSMYAAERHR